MGYARNREAVEGEETMASLAAKSGVLRTSRAKNGTVCCNHNEESNAMPAMPLQLLWLETLDYAHPIAEERQGEQEGYKGNLPNPR